MDFSITNFFKWAFALSPFPSYLPQYYAMMHRLKPPPLSPSCDESNNGHDSVSSPKSHMTIERGGDYLRKRNHLHGSNASLADVAVGANLNTTSTTAPTSNNLHGGLLVPGTPSKPFDDAMHSTISTEEGEVEAGLSRATVFLLLAAHLIRMLYFHGLYLEEHQPVHLRASAGYELDQMMTGSNALGMAADEMAKILSSQPTTTLQRQQSAIQWDLLGQSVSMIVVQIMLLHGMVRLRRRHKRRIRKRNHSDALGAEHENQPSPSGPPQSNSFVFAPSIQHKHNGNMSTPPTNNQHPQTFLQRQCQNLTRATTSHILHLISPSNIMQHHSFQEYLELLFLSSMAIKLVFDYHWYPHHRMRVVEGLKHTSIVLESCLALPQAIRNHGRGTTEGLSVVMVGGWVAGDFFKLCYFLLGMIGSKSSGGGVDEGNNVFALGCLLALSVDLIVAMQMVWWYPTPEVTQLRERVVRAVRHWKANKDDDGGESIMKSSSQYQHSGLFASIVRSFFRQKNKSDSSLES